MDVTSVATAVAAVFTGAGVLLALWLQIVRPVRRRPSLTMSFIPNSDDLGYVRSEDSTWLRFRVANANNRDTAESVEVLLVTVRLRDDAKPPGQDPFPTKRLKWADMGSSLVNIPPGMFRYVDVGFIRPTIRDAFVYRFWPPALDEDTLRDGRRGSDDGRYWIEREGVYEFEFAVSARYAKASFFAATIELRRVRQSDGHSPLQVCVLSVPTSIRKLHY
jgi:hypothetical protein